VQVLVSVSLLTSNLIPPNGAAKLSEIMSTNNAIIKIK